MVYEMERLDPDAPACRAPGPPKALNITSSKRVRGCINLSPSRLFTLTGLTLLAADRMKGRTAK
ncbi:hypothetical protein Tdes44962_MAKER08465 [Teratosphaeria destructans]|uniref:Uncharacterized protein n=1 Tax=Teratosphaeria destructans TaxID=418781 RepID=A0A9W7SX18_9PEZI|nr:hypothetical protein Tdes44962_MAKER08465 [Teratosphaeria destructans]